MNPAYFRKRGKMRDLLHPNTKMNQVRVQKDMDSHCFMR
jgi:hypothetical protein